MLWGSCYPDAPNIFLTDAELLKDWGHGQRKWMVVPGDMHDHVTELLGDRAVLVQDLADKSLYTDRAAGAVTYAGTAGWCLSVSLDASVARLCCARPFTSR